LLIVDFAPHELDFLREEQAHRRLGFGEDEVKGWLSQAGLEMSELRRLPPPEGEEGATLTVMIYAADKPADRSGSSGNKVGELEDAGA
jgi:ArsR family transcriptional regulator